MSAYRVSIYDGGQHPAKYPYKSVTCATEREARREAARMLGRSSLRGSSSWERYQGGTVFRFGPHDEDNGHDFTVIEEVV